MISPGLELPAPDIHPFPYFRLSQPTDGPILRLRVNNHLHSTSKIYPVLHKVYAKGPPTSKRNETIRLNYLRLLSLSTARQFRTRLHFRPVNIL